MTIPILVRGGGDLASGVALRLYRIGLPPIITEIPRPLAVRRLVSFAEAVYSGETTVEGVTARRVDNLSEASIVLDRGQIPVLVDPQAAVLEELPLRRILVDGRMTKRAPEIGREAAMLVVGLGPGFVAGENCHAVIETRRGHTLGRVIWQGAPESDTGVPDGTGRYDAQRALRAPCDGILHDLVDIGDHVEPGQLIAEVAAGVGDQRQPVIAPFAGMICGLLRSGSDVSRGLKIGDVDPRDNPLACRLISDKALAIGGGVLEAILSRADLRPFLWNDPGIDQ
jgi:xanthine dehydrogenase accessory factor